MLDNSINIPYVGLLAPFSDYLMEHVHYNLVIEVTVPMLFLLAHQSLHKLLFGLVALDHQSVGYEHFLDEYDVSGA
jgi:hypothetical protein